MRAVTIEPMPDMPELFTLVVAEPVALLGYAVFGMVGFGTTLVAAPVLAHVLPVSTVIPALALTDFIASWVSRSRPGGHVVKAELWRLLPAMFVGSALGAAILFAVPVRALMLLLGAFVMLYALNGLRRGKAPPTALSPRWAWWFGGAGGMLSALFGAGGWVYAIYLSRRLTDPVQVRSTQIAVLTVSSSIRVGLFAVAGRYFDGALLVLALALLPAMALGLWLGHRIARQMDRSRFLQALYGVLLLTGGSLLVRALSG